MPPVIIGTYRVRAKMQDFMGGARFARPIKQDKTGTILAVLGETFYIDVGEEEVPSDMVLIGVIGEAPFWYPMVLCEMLL